MILLENNEIKVVEMVDRLNREYVMNKEITIRWCKLSKYYSISNDTTSMREVVGRGMRGWSYIVI